MALRNPMVDDAHKPHVLDYGRPDDWVAVWRAATWPFKVAYALMALPIIYVGTAGSVNPVPVERRVTLCVLMGIALGAGLFVVRRDRRNIVGWIGLLGWGGLSLFAITNALWG